MTASTSADRASLTIPGAAMVLCASLVTYTMSFHPTNAHSTLVEPVHAGMITIHLILLFAFTRFAGERGWRRSAVLAGWVAYIGAAASTIAAGVINGFIVPALAERGLEVIGRDIFIMLREANQALDWCGVMMTGGAYALWSLDLLRGPSVLARGAALFGFAAAGFPAAALLLKVYEMNVEGALILYSIHAAFALIVGLLMIFRKV